MNNIKDLITTTILSIVMIDIIKWGYPYSYLVVIPVSLSILLYKKTSKNIYVLILIALIYLSAIYSINSLKFHRFLNVGDISNLSITGHYFMVYQYTLTRISYLIFSEYIDYIMKIYSFILFYSVFVLLSKTLKIKKDRCLLILAFIAPFIQSFGFPFSVYLAIIAFVFLLQGSIILSLLFFAVSVFYGTRGLILIGIPYLINAFAKANYKLKIIILLIILVLPIILYKYVLYNLSMINSFLNNVTISQLYNRLFDFLMRTRFQPQIDFYFILIAFIAVLLWGLIYLVREFKQGLLLISFTINIIILLMLFAITFAGRISTFENPASDIPYYFLYPAVIMSILIASYLTKNEKIYTTLVAFFVIILFLAYVPKLNYVSYYEQTFNFNGQYYNLLTFIHDFGLETHILYDYGSYKFSKFIPDGKLLQPWQSPYLFHGYIYIYSTSIYRLKMFFTLPYIQNQLISVSKTNIIYSTPQYRISLIP